MGSLEREYKGNQLNFGKTFAIDSGKGSNYTGHFVINDSGKPMPGWFTDGTSKSYQKYLKFYIEHSKFKTLEKLVFECSQSMQKKFKLKNIRVSINKISVAKRYGCESLSVSQ